MLVAAAGWFRTLVMADGDARGAATAAAPAAPARPLPWALGCAIGWVAATALVWDACYGYVAWDLHQRSADALAEYEPVEAAAAAQSPGRGREHLALRGRVLGDHVVSRTSSNSSEVWQTLVLVVERGWREGDPVHFVVRLDKHDESALREASPRSSELLVRADGSVPTPALQVFAKMTAPIADDAVAVRLVVTEGGRPAPAPREADWSGAVVRAVVGTFSVTLFALVMLATPWLQARRLRKQALR